MNIFKGVLAVAAAVALTLTGATVASAGPAHAATVTITFDADGYTQLPLAAAAADWSKNTDVSVVTGDCTTGKYCVHFLVTPNENGNPDSFPCGLGVAGCAYGLADGSCQVEISGFWLTQNETGWLDDLLVKHEGGHCIFRAGGYSQSAHLPDEPHALMSATQPSSPTKRDATLTSTDRSFTRSLF